MLQDKDIIIFGSDRWEYPGLQQTIMKVLSARNRVLFVNPLGTRRVALKASEFGIYVKRAIGTFRRSAGNGTAWTNVFLCNPRMIPLVYNRAIMSLNRFIMRGQFRRLLARLDFREYILWAGTPTAACFLDLFDPTLLIYNPVDRYSEFSFVDRGRIVGYEREIASRADAVICTADAIRRDLEPYNDHCFTVTHGVDVGHFRSALERSDVPADLRDIPGPIIGFVGGIAEWVDLDLLHEIAERHPRASLVLIGRTHSDLNGLERLKERPNVHFLGYKEFGILPQYLKHFSVCLIPYVVNDRLVAVDPIKLREYLALGKPVVSVDLPEVRKLQDLVYLAANRTDFVAKVGEALTEDLPSLGEERVRAAWQSDWGRKIEEISEIVHDALGRRSSDEAREGPPAVRGPNRGTVRTAV